MAAVTTLPAAFTVGQVLTSTQINDLRGAFRVLQVVSATFSTVATSLSSTYADTGLTVSITPTFTSSKILVLVSQNGCNKLASDTQNEIQLVRGATSLGIFCAQGGLTSSAANNNFGSASHVFLDSPATISATTYKTQFRSTAATNGVQVQANSSQSGIVVLEISA